jgi:hypothetical protein
VIDSFFGAVFFLKKNLLFFPRWCPSLLTNSSVPTVVMGFVSSFSSGPSFPATSFFHDRMIGRGIHVDIFIYSVWKSELQLLRLSTMMNKGI